MVVMITIRLSYQFINGNGCGGMKEYKYSHTMRAIKNTSFNRLKPP